MAIGYWLSWSYWFSSRTLGLLNHPYITMREIVRAQFLRPLAVLPTVIWILSWIVAVLIGRIGLIFDLDKTNMSIYLGRILVFLWWWGSWFLVLWQIVLGYLYVRFNRIRE
jgi:hypothetical protein